MGGADTVILVVADSYFKRLRGLLGMASLPENQGLWIPNCRLVHTIGMKFDLALHFLDTNHQIVRSYARVKPGRVVWCRCACSVIEMSALKEQEQWQAQINALQNALCLYKGVECAT